MTINYFAVFVSAIVGMGLGSLWYGPLFGKQWAHMMGWSYEHMQHMMNKDALKSYGIMFVGLLFMSWILAHTILFASVYLSWYGATSGAIIGALNWLGFVAPVTIGSVLWEGKSWKLWALNAGYYLVVIVVIGTILGAW